MNVQSNKAMWIEYETWRLVWDSLIPPSPGPKERLLDVGPAAHVWTCSDYTVERADRLERRGETKLHKFDFDQPWPFFAETFEVSTALEVIEHVENPWHFLREIMRVTRRRAILTTPSTLCPLSRATFAAAGVLNGFSRNEVETAEHLTPIFPWQIELAAKKNGWKIVRLEEIDSPKTFVGKMLLGACEVLPREQVFALGARRLLIVLEHKR
jgi:hypothetical protein